MVSLQLFAASVVHNATAATTQALEKTEGVSGASTVRGIVEEAGSLPATPAAAEQGAGLLHNATAVVHNATAAVNSTASSLTGAGTGAADAANAAGAAASLAGTSFSWGGYFQAIGTLFLLLALLWGAVWAVRKYGKFNFIPKPGVFPRESLRLEAQLPLGPRKGLMVVRFLNKRLLLGVTDHQITLLTESAEHHDESNNAEFKDIFEAERRQKTDA